MVSMTEGSQRRNWENWLEAFKSADLGAGENGSAVKSVNCSCRDSRLNSQCRISDMLLQAPVLMSMHTHACNYKIKFKKNTEPRGGDACL